MRAAALLSSRETPRPSQPSWRKIIDMPGGGWPGNCVDAAYYNGNTYVGYIDGDGAIRVSSYNHASGAVTTSPALVSGLAVDIHIGVSVQIRQSDQRILVATCKHNVDATMYFGISTNPEDVSAWTVTNIGATLAGTKYTYTNLFQLSGESGKLYLFYRDQVSPGTYALAYSTSTDGGTTWAAQTALYQVSAKQSYWAIDSDSVSRIDIATSDGSAGNGDTSSLWHFYYSGGSFHKSDGTVIAAAKPYGTASLTKVSDAATDGSVRAPYQVVTAGGPYIVWAAYNVAGSAHPENYWYAAYSGGWTHHVIDDSGVVPDIAFQEGGVALDRISTAVAYVSRSIAGQWQLLQYRTPDGGSTWTSVQLTTDVPQPNLRPLVPRDEAAGLGVFFMYGPQGTFTGDPSFSCQIRAHPGPAVF